MDSTAQTAPRDLDIIIETAATGDAWLQQRKQPLGLRNHHRNCSTGDAWIQQLKATLVTQNHQRNWCHG